MVKIRLRRVGAKKQPSFRIVVTDSRSPRDGRFIEVIGFYNPRTEPETVTIQEDRALYWLDVGAQPTRAVQRLLVKQGAWGRFERLKQGEDIDALLAEAEAAALADTEAEEAPQAPEPTETEDEEQAQEAPVEETTEEAIDAAEDEVEITEPSDDEENEENKEAGIEVEETEEPTA